MISEARGVARRPSSVDLILATMHRTEEPRRLVEALAKQSYSRFRLIVVDQNTDDRLDSVLAGVSRFPILHLHSEPGNSRARNVGLRNLDADLVAFPDDDCWYPPDLLERVVRLLAGRPELDGVSARSVTEDGRSSGGRWGQKPGTVNRFNVWTRANAYTVFLRSSVVDGHIWFDEAMGLGPDTVWPAGEDLDYVLRILERGCRLNYEPSLCVYHPRTREHVSKPDPAEGYRYGLGMGRALKKNGLPWWFAVYMFARSFGLAALEAVRGNADVGAFYKAVGRGRVAGWRSEGT